MSNNYYTILGVEKNASDEQIKKAYRNLAKEHHPDKGGNKETFQKIQEAYNTLSDPEKRKLYDNPNSINQEFMNNIFSSNFQTGFSFDFKDFFHGTSHRLRKRKDHSFIYEISLQDVYNGLTKQFNLKRSLKCQFCEKMCEVCQGSGKISQKIHMGPLVQIMNHPCKNCFQTGKIQNKHVKCEYCLSTGFITEEKRIEIDIPKGVEDGKNYVFAEWGEQPVNQNEIAGDFIIIIKIKNETKFKRENLNLFLNVNLTFKESIIGKEIFIHYFNNVKLKLNTKKFGIINPNNHYAINNKGLENNKGEKGNLYVKFNIEYPNDFKLSDENINSFKELFEKIGIN